MATRSCLYCTTAFDADNRRKVFCSGSCKARYNREMALCCFYCGEMAECRGHLTPQSFNASSAVNDFMNCDVVKCCNDCNMLLGASFPTDLIQRVGLLADRIYARYKLSKVIPEWDEDEVTELGPNLRRAVRSMLREREVGIRRYLTVTGTLRALCDLEQTPYTTICEGTVSQTRLQ